MWPCEQGLPWRPCIAPAPGCALSLPAVSRRARRRAARAAADKHSRVQAASLLRQSARRSYLNRTLRGPLASPPQCPRPSPASLCMRAHQVHPSSLRRSSPHPPPHIQVCSLLQQRRTACRLPLRPRSQCGGCLQQALGLRPHPAPALPLACILRSRELFPFARCRPQAPHLQHTSIPLAACPATMPPAACLAITHSSRCGAPLQPASASSGLRIRPIQRLRTLRGFAGFPSIRAHCSLLTGCAAL
jgi:hypothetical protein